MIIKTKYRNNAFTIILRIFICISCLFISSLFNSSYAKTMLPIEVKSILKGYPKSGEPISIVIKVKSEISINDGLILLSIPSIGFEQSRQIFIWRGNSETPINKEFDHSVGLLPEGEYKFHVTFEVTPLGTSKKSMKVTENLYVEVWKDRIYSSNVSFKQIKRYQIKEEIEKRGLSNLPKSKQMETAPELIRQMDELNRVDREIQPIVNSNQPSVGPINNKIPKKLINNNKSIHPSKETKKQGDERKPIPLTK